MRIVIVGDLQNDTFESISKVAHDIDTLSPDYVVTVGDYGTWNGFGTYESFKEIANAFSCIKAKEFIPLLGNHDIQYESGEYKYAPGTIKENYTRAFGHSHENAFIDIYDGDKPCAMLVCVHLTPQSKENYAFFHECHVDDKDFAEIERRIKERPTLPVIIVTHAPPAGAEMLCVPSVHVRAGNAYMDQDHDIHRWARLARQNRNIVMWLCGHYHVGHHHPKSTNVKDGVTYMMVGSPVAASRDGQRHTRVIDISDGMAYVTTFDHISESLECVPERSIPLEVRLPYGNYDKSHVPFCVACGNILADEVKQGKNGKLYIPTDNNILWEVDIINRVPMGVLHYSEKLELLSYKLCDNLVYRKVKEIDTGEISYFTQILSDNKRFMREFDYDDCNTNKVSRDEYENATNETSDDFSFDEKNGIFTIGENTLCRIFTDDEGLVWVDTFESVKK